MEFLFLFVSVIAVASAGMMLTRKNAVHSALFLIVNFGCVAFLYLMLDAPFLSMVQVAVYAGAIMVLFLFVIMLLGAEVTTDTSGRMRWVSLAGAGVALVLLLAFGIPVASDLLSDEGLQARTGTASVRVINAVPSGAETEYALESEFGTVPITTDELAVDVSLDSAEGEDTTLSNIVYGDERAEMRSYIDVPAGEYNVTVTETLSLASLESQSLDLAIGDAQSIIVYQNEAGEIDYSILEDDISPTASGSMRLTLFNGVSGTAVSLADVGQYSDVSTLCDDANCDSLLPHRTIIEDLPFAETTTIDLKEGTYNLAFVDESNDVLTVLRDFEAERGEVETRLVVIEPGVLGGPSSFRVVEYGAVARPAFGSPEAIGQVLFIDYLLPVQLVGILLLVALIGVIVLARPDALAQAERRRINRRRRVNRPLVSVLSQQTGSNVLSGDYQAKLTGGSDDDPQDE